MLSIYSRHEKHILIITTTNSKYLHICTCNYRNQRLDIYNTEHSSWTHGNPLTSHQQQHHPHQIIPLYFYTMPPHQANKTTTHDMLQQQTVGRHNIVRADRCRLHHGSSTNLENMLRLNFAKRRFGNVAKRKAFKRHHRLFVHKQILDLKKFPLYAGRKFFFFAILGAFCVLSSFTLHFLSCTFTSIVRFSPVQPADL